MDEVMLSEPMAKQRWTDTRFAAPVRRRLFYGYTKIEAMRARQSWR